MKNVKTNGGLKKEPTNSPKFVPKVIASSLNWTVTLQTFRHH